MIKLFSMFDIDYDMSRVMHKRSLLLENLCAGRIVHRLMFLKVQPFGFSMESGKYSQ